MLPTLRLSFRVLLEMTQLQLIADSVISSVLSDVKVTVEFFGQN